MFLAERVRISLMAVGPLQTSVGNWLTTLAHLALVCALC